MATIYVDEDVRASREGFLQVGCKVCYCAQDIPKPPPYEDVTIFQCIRCQAINTLRHNSAEWRRAQLAANIVLYVVIMLCALFVLGAVWWAAWRYL